MLGGFTGRSFSVDMFITRMLMRECEIIGRIIFGASFVTFVDNIGNVSLAVKANEIAGIRKHCLSRCNKNVNIAIEGQHSHRAYFVGYEPLYHRT